MSNLEILLKPFRLRHLELKNRVITTSHAPAYAEDGMPQERYQLYQEERAKGGVAMIMFGGSSTVSPDSPATFGQICIDDDRVIPYLRELADRIHYYNTAIICQITHMGRRSRWDIGSWLPSVAPSSRWEPEHQSFPKEMEDWDFRRIVDDFVAAVRRCREAKLDGVELSFNAQHLIPQFWSPGVNHRTDDYGGSLENRMRFGFEILDAVRKEIGDAFIVGIRLSVDELLDNGLSDADCREIAVILARSGKVDFFNVVGGQPSDFPSHAVNMAGMAFPVAPFLHLASALKSVVEIPVIQAHRISDLHTAAKAVEDRHLDLVGLTRPHMADPYIMKKLMEGRVDDIRQCIGANYCIDRLFAGKEALCIQAPATGREATMPHIIAKASEKKQAVVIGGGPGGLEASRVLAERGHHVVLFEATEHLGGQVKLAACATWRNGLDGITRWLVSQIDKLGVIVHLSTLADADRVKAEKPDIVIVATGGHANKGYFKGNDLAVSTWDIISGQIEPGENVLLYDDNDGHQGMSCAEVLAKKGSKVEIVTPDRFTGRDVGGTSFPVYLRNLYQTDTIFSPDLKLIEIQREGNLLIPVLRNIYSGIEEERAVDQVVCEHGSLPNDELYFALKNYSTNLGEVDYYALRENSPQNVTTNPDGEFVLFRVGDAVSSRNIHAAIFDSLRLCKDL